MRRFLTALTAAVLLVSGLVATPTVAQAAAPSPPRLTSPAAGASAPDNPVLRWSPVAGATSYTVEVSSTTAFTTKAWSSVTSNTAAVPTKDLAAGTWHWRVRTTTATANSDYSEVRTFVKAQRAAPTPVYPVNRVATPLVYPQDSYYFEWQPLTGTATYEVQVANEPAFNTPSTLTTATTRVSPLTPPVFGTQLYWRVKAKSVTGTESRWSDPATFTMDWNASNAVSLKKPLSTNTDPIDEVMLEWDAKPGAAYYEVDIDRDINFNDPVVTKQKAYGTQWAPDLSLDLAAYYWRVRAVSTNGQPGPYSPTWTFTRRWPALDDTDQNAQVRLLAPADQASVVEPQLSWTPQKKASSYIVHIGTDEFFSTGTYSSCETGNTSLTPYAKGQVPSGVTDPGCNLRLTPGVRYFWRVLAQDEPHRPQINGSLWSQTRSFRWNLTSPVKTSPAAGATTTSGVLSWQPVQGVSLYKVNLKGTTSSCNDDTILTYNTRVVPSGLTPGCSYTWDVQSVASVLTTATNGPTSPGLLNPPVFHYAAAATGGTLGTPTVTQQPGQEHLAPVFAWTPIPNASEYEVLISDSGANLWTRSGITKSPAWVHTGIGSFGPLRPGSYDVTVRAKDSSGTVIGTSGAATFTIQRMAYAVKTGPTHCPLSTCTAQEKETPTFSWQHVPGAAMYQVYLATDPNFANITHVYSTRHSTLTTASLFADAQAGQATYWYVRPCVNSENCGSFGSGDYPQSWAFRKLSAQVQTVAPTSGQVVRAGEVNFDWTDYLVTNRAVGARQTGLSYSLEVANNPAFSPVLDRVSNLDQTRYTAPTKTYPDGPLYWRVRAVDFTGNLLPWSTVVQFSKAMAAPTPLAPATGTTTATLPRLSWSPDPYSAQFEVEIYTYPGTIAPTNRVATIKTRNTVAVPTGALAAGEYQWRVRRIDAGGNFGSWSDELTAPWRFKVSAVPATLLSPSNNSEQSGPELAFSWRPVEGATQYRLQVSSSSTFATLLENSVTDTTSFAPTLRTAYPDGRLYWRVLALDGKGAVLSTSAAWSIMRDRSTRGEFAAVSPYRVLDTRIKKRPLGAGGTQTVRLTGGSTGIPTRGVSAVVLNATSVKPTAASYLSVYPAGSTRPTVSSLNWVAGQTVANHVTVPVSSTGSVTLYNNRGSVDVLFDVVGYYSDGSLTRATRYTPAPAAARIADTRLSGGTPLAHGETRAFEVAGRGGVPSGATAVVANVTAVKPTKAGYLTVFPTGRTRPNASSLNFAAGTVVPNLVTMPLGGGKFSIYNPAGSTDVLVDVVGWYSAGDPAAGYRFTRVSPSRIVDTRNKTAPNPIPGTTSRTFQVAGRAGIPTGGSAKAAVVNVTVVEPVRAGWVTVYPSGTSRPETSNLNYSAGQTVPNQVIAPVGSDGKIAVYTSATAEVLVDVVGWLG